MPGSFFFFFSRIRDGDRCFREEWPPFGAECALERKKRGRRLKKKEGSWCRVSRDRNVFYRVSWPHRVDSWPLVPDYGPRFLFIAITLLGVNCPRRNADRTRCSVAQLWWET